LDKAAKSKVNWSIRNNHPITCTVIDLNEKEEEFLFTLLRYILGLFDKKHYVDQIFYCLKELVVNGQKANYKRILFDELDLDLHEPEDYNKGILEFKDKVFSRVEDFRKKHKHKGMYVKVSFHVNPKSLDIWVRNTAKATSYEIDRIREKVERAHEYDNVQDALMRNVDDEEGAGLGIIILTLMLKKLGVTQGGFHYRVSPRETQVVIHLPMTALKDDPTLLIYEKVIEAIESLPPFPEHLQELEKKIKDRNSSSRDISSHVIKDRNLSANVLKLANSALYGVSGNVSDISEGVKIIGLSALENLMYSAGVEQVFQSIKGSYEIFQDNQKIADLALGLAKYYKIPRKFWETIFVGAYLYNIGLFTYDQLNPGVRERFAGFCLEKDIPTSVLEDVFTGYNYSEIGAMLAKKWNFPLSLASVIEYHTYPAACDKQNIPSVYTVHLAVVLYQAFHSKESLTSISFEVRSYFKITNQEEYQKLLQMVKNNFTI